jgi:hypothetical protein
VATLVAAVLSTTAGAAPEAVDIVLAVGADTQGERPTRLPNGATATFATRNFWVMVVLDLPSTAPGGAVRVRAELGGGLRWGSDDPDPSEGCTSTPTVGTCEARTIAGQSGDGWGWQVVAPSEGSYTFTAEIVDAYDADPNTSNNASSITIVVTASPPTTPPPSANIAASRVTLAPTKPKAGSTVVASVRVTKGGSPLRPTGVGCSASVGRAKVKGGPKAASGTASCLFKTPKTGKGKTFAGAVSFTADGTAFTKRFAVKLG